MIWAVVIGWLAAMVVMQYALWRLHRSWVRREWRKGR